MSDRLRQCFDEEARELLTELETALLELERDPDDPENVGRAFRALHTIKGSGAMFGFDNIAAFTHDLEAVFDRLRAGRLAVSSALINLTLRASDQIRAMLDEAFGRGQVDGQYSETLLMELRKLAGLSGPDKEAPAPARATGSTVGAGPERQWRIHFQPGPDIVLNGTNPLLLLAELRQLGRLDVVLDASSIPALADIDPERCYAAWDIVLTTAAPLEAIRDVFIFIEDACELTIEGIQPGPEGRPARAEARPRQPCAGAGGNNSASASSIRVATEKLDQLVNLVGELVTVQARLSEIAARRDDADVLAVSEEVGRLTAELRENSMSIRMLPLRGTFERFRRLVHDLCAELDKRVELVIEGGETELDKTVIDQLNDPLVHLIRNAMDHGIESAEMRRRSGKPEVATVRLSARHSGAQVLIQVADDGQGLDTQAVRARAIEKGLMDPSAQIPESELYAVIFQPGFSTARDVTDVSGRGVGMDVVRRNVEALRGSIELASKPGQGLTVTLRLPLTLAIIDGLLVRVGGTHFVLPLANSLECVELSTRDIDKAHGNHLAIVRGETIPYIRLSEYLGLKTDRPEREQIMVVETGDGQYGLVVDEVLGNHQTVIKNLGRLYRNVQTVSGATILGNGNVALILDPHRLVENAIRHSLDRRAPSRASHRRQITAPRPADGQSYARKEESTHAS